MISLNKKIAVVTVFFAHLACGRVPSSFEQFSAQELQRQYRAVEERIRFWEKRQEDAIPKELMTDQRRAALEEERKAADLVRALKQHGRALQGQLIYAEAQVARIKQKINENLRNRHAAEQKRKDLAENSKEWKQRSTSEKAEGKLAAFRRKRHEIKAAFHEKSWLDQLRYPLH